MWKRTIAIAVCILASIIHFSRLHAYDGIVEKKTFPLKNYVTVGGETIKDVKIGWESYGSLNADRSNAILITHYFSGTSHAAGKYKAELMSLGEAINLNEYGRATSHLRRLFECLGVERKPRDLLFEPTPDDYIARLPADGEVVEEPAS